MTDTTVETAPEESAEPGEAQLPAAFEGTPPPAAADEAARASEEKLPEALGTRRLADLMAERMGLSVTAHDVMQLVEEHQALEAVDEYNGWPMYATAAALALEVELVRQVVEKRREWVKASLPRDAAAERIGWHWRDIVRMGREGRITVGRFDRYLISDLDKLAAEADGEQYITAQAAAELLEIRPSDWKYVEAAGWIEAASSYEQPVGRYRTVTVALFKLGEVRALREMPGVDWEAVRAVPKGKPSALKEYAKLAPTRAAAIKDFCQALADRHGVTVWAWCSPYSGGWEMDWERLDGAPTKAQVKDELAADPQAGRYAKEVSLCPRWGRITRRARQLLQPDTAVILDTETTDLDGQCIEIAVIDAATGKKLMNTLVKPTEPISQGAHWVHGISDEDVAGARPWERVLPRLRKVTRDRVICAYNSSFDRNIVLGDTRRAGKKPMHLEPWDNWYCLMESYASWVGSSRWLPLGGGHRALGDTQAAREVLVEMSQGRGTTFTPQAPLPGDPVPGPSDGTALAAVPGQLSGEPAPA
ncbi:3'-5' exonuclease [Streptomyces mirabilis]|uniref:3'-5' exonuclease n=1 Tax=Streptomyces mirabilis TaxID=68239 RepID=UPI0033F87E62